MAFTDYSTTPALNVTINGIDIDEQCAPGNINGAIRQLMADAKTWANSAQDTSALMPKAGGAFTGSITRSGAGGYTYHAAAAQSGGAIHTLAIGSSLPASPAEGPIVFFY